MYVQGGNVKYFSVCYNCILSADVDSVTCRGCTGVSRVLRVSAASVFCPREECMSVLGEGCHRFTAVGLKRADSDA